MKISIKKKLFPIDKKGKPPYMPVNKGYGYLGVLLYEPISDEVQCHICGKLFESLGQHIKWKHKITTRQYRKEFSLLVDCRLCGNELREIRSERQSKYYKENNLKDKLINKKGTNTRNIRNLSMEEMNKFGNCPLQIEIRFKKIASKLGKTPTKRNLGEALYKAIRNRFGSYNKFLKYMSYPLNKEWRMFNKKQLLNILKEYKKLHNKLPVINDFRAGRVPQLFSIRPYQTIFGSFSKAKEYVL